MISLGVMLPPPSRPPPWHATAGRLRGSAASGPRGPDWRATARCEPPRYLQASRLTSRYLQPPPSAPSGRAPPAPRRPRSLRTRASGVAPAPQPGDTSSSTVARGRSGGRAGTGGERAGPLPPAPAATKGIGVDRLQRLRHLGIGGLFHLQQLTLRPHPPQLVCPALLPVYPG